MKLLLLSLLSISSLFSLYTADYDASSDSFIWSFDGNYDNGFIHYNGSLNINATQFYDRFSNTHYMPKFVDTLNAKFGTSYTAEDIKNNVYVASKDSAYSSSIPPTTSTPTVSRNTTTSTSTTVSSVSTSLETIKDTILSIAPFIILLIVNFIILIIVIKFIKKPK